MAGILSPDGPLGRRFVDLAGGDTVEMERPEPGEDSVQVGRFVVRQAAFDWAEARLTRAAEGQGASTLVVDEIGPLELQGRGLARALRSLLERSSVDLVLVVRETLLDRVIAEFGLEQPALLDLPHPGLSQDGQGGSARR